MNVITERICFVLLWIITYGFPLLYGWQNNFSMMLMFIFVIMGSVICTNSFVNFKTKQVYLFRSWFPYECIKTPPIKSEKIFYEIALFFIKMKMIALAGIILWPGIFVIIFSNWGGYSYFMQILIAAVFSFIPLLFAFIFHKICKRVRLPEEYERYTGADTRLLDKIKMFYVAAFGCICFLWLIFYLYTLGMFFF